MPGSFFFAKNPEGVQNSARMYSVLPPPPRAVLFSSFNGNLSKIILEGGEQHGDGKERRQRHPVRVCADHHDPRHGERAEGAGGQHPGTVRACTVLH